MFIQRAAAVAALACLAVVALFTATSHAQIGQAYLLQKGEATPPIGWVEFCETPAGKADCQVPPVKEVFFGLDERKWRELLAINAAVNREVEPITDMDQWGVPEHWSYPTTGKGDCEDYVLQKRRLLMNAGWPRAALLITVVRDKKGDGHAVLIVRTDRGDFILDNQEKKVLVWYQTVLSFVKRQAAENPNRWVALGNVAGMPARTSKTSSR